MKKILFLLAFLFPATVFPFKYYQPGDTLYVWDYHGVSLHSSPSHDAKRVADLRYGAAVVVVKYDSLFRVEDSFEFFKLDTSANAGWRNFWNMETPPEIPSVGIQGYWVKVCFHGTEGYVSDVQLSKLHPLRYQTRQVVYEHVTYSHLKLESFREYATREFGLLETYGNDTLFDENENRYGRSVYRGGILNVEEGGSAWSNSTFIFPRYSFEEGLLFVERFLQREIFPEDPVASAFPASSWAVIAYESQQKLVLSFELAEIVVEQKGSLLVITFFASC